MKKFISASINLNTSNNMNIGKVKQLDDVELNLNVYSNGVATSIDGQTISLFVRRSNNTTVQQVEGITPAGSTLKIKCKNSCFAVPGNTELELRLVDSTGGMSTSFFYVEVKEAISSNDNIDIAKDEYEILDKIAADEVIRQSNEDNRKNNENTRQSNEVKRQVTYEEIKGISSDIFKSSGSETKLVTSTDWVDNTDSNSSAKYMYDIVHALKSTDVILDIYSSTSNMSMFKNCRVISDSIVRLFSDDKVGVKVVLVACYNIQGKQAYDEVVAARGSCSTLKERVDGIDTQISKNTQAIDTKGVYESGTFTPVLYCSTGGSKILTTTTNFAVYNRNGNLVTLYFSIAVSNWDTSWSGESLLLKGVPYVRDLNKWGTGTITIYTGMKTPVKALGLTAHGTAHNSWWVRRQTDVTFGNLQLSYLEQAFTLEGWIQYTTV